MYTFLRNVFRRCGTYTGVRGYVRDYVGLDALFSRTFYHNQERNIPNSFAKRTFP